MKLPTKKFKIRIRHASNQYYYIEYASYRFFPIWRKLHRWLRYTGCWSNSFTLDNMPQLNSKSDLNNYIIEQDKLCSSYVKSKPKPIIAEFRTKEILSIEE